MQFREDINGLRSIAVLAVVLFHFNESIMPGGFAGVDVFFVISGFLMTGIIIRGLNENTFSLLEFYKSRIKRIVPALAVLCLFSIVYGFFFLYDIEFKDTVNQAASGMTFLSNFYFWKTSSYFSAGSETKMLLHTWSLSTEWQFYMVYPVVMLALSKFVSVKKLPWFVFLGFILSLAVSVYASPKWATTSYYLLPTRVWQMLLGGLACFTVVNLSKNKLNLLSFIGLTLIVLSCFIISEEDVWPGYLALIPCVGTFAILIGNPDFVLLKHKTAQLIGRYSYSIYLWHWVVVFMVYRYTDMDAATIALGVLLSLLLGMLSYEFIEKNGLSRMNKTLVLIAVFLPVVSYFAFDGITQYRGMSNTDNNKLVTYYQEHDHNSAPWVENLCEDSKACEQGGVFLWGDSHGRALHYGLSRSDLKNFTMMTGRSCPPSITYPDYKHSVRVACNKHNKASLEQIKLKRPETVILVRRHKHETADWESISLSLKGLGVEKVVVLGPVPQFNIPLPLLVARKYMHGDRVKLVDMDETIFASNDMMLQLKSNQYQYVDVLGQLCSDGECKFRVENQNNHTLINFDAGHLSNEGSEYIVNNFILGMLQP